MKMTKKKGFTVVELVIVIAVIAVLAAVLIPTFVTLVNRANNSADTQMVANLNKYLAAMEALDGKNETMADAMADAADAGYTAGAFTSATNTILWDSKTDRFLAVNENGKGIVKADVEGAEYPKDETGKYWVVSSTEISKKYATYLTGKTLSGTVEVELGLDLTEFKGDALSVTVKATGVKLNGTIKKLTAGEYTPTVYGYVYELNGDVESKNATFHMLGDNEEDKTKINGTGTISGSYGIEHLPVAAEGTTKCAFCECDLKPQHVHAYAEDENKLVPARCETVGWKYLVCSCGQSSKVEQIAALGHDEVKHEGKAATCTEDGWKAYVTCSRCEHTTYEKIDALGHTPATTPAVSATCTKTGLTEGKHCSVCEAVLVKQEVVEAKGHAEVIDAAVSATCTKTGLTEGKHCSVCEAVLVKQEVVEALGHKWDKGTITKAATCTTDGKKEFKCERCTATDTATIAHGHVWYKIDGKPATCTEYGLTDGYKCNVCGKVGVAQQYIPAGHQYGDSEIKKKPTCTEHGYAVGTCQKCGKEEYSYLPALGHREGTDGKCTVCGETVYHIVTSATIAKKLQDKESFVKDSVCYVRLEEDVKITTTQFKELFTEKKSESLTVTWSDGEISIWEWEEGKIDRAEFDLNGHILEIVDDELNGELLWEIESSLRISNGTFIVKAGCYLLSLENDNSIAVFEDVDIYCLGSPLCAEDPAVVRFSGCSLHIFNVNAPGSAIKTGWCWSLGSASTAKINNSRKVWTASAMPELNRNDYENEKAYLDAFKVEVNKCTWNSDNAQSEE